MDHQVLELALKKIEDERKSIVENLADGVAKDYAEYQNLCGKIIGLQIAEREIAELRQRLKFDDEAYDD